MVKNYSRVESIYFTSTVTIWIFNAVQRIIFLILLFLKVVCREFVFKGLSTWLFFNFFFFDATSLHVVSHHGSPEIPFLYCLNCYFLGKWGMVSSVAFSSFEFKVKQKIKKKKGFMSFLRALCDKARFLFCLLMPHKNNYQNISTIKLLSICDNFTAYINLSKKQLCSIRE